MPGPRTVNSDYTSPLFPADTNYPNARRPKTLRTTATTAICLLSGSLSCGTERLELRFHRLFDGPGGGGPSFVAFDFGRFVASPKMIPPSAMTPATIHSMGMFRRKAATASPKIRMTNPRR